MNAHFFLLFSLISQADIRNPLRYLLLFATPARDLVDSVKFSKNIYRFSFFIPQIPYDLLPAYARFQLFFSLPLSSHPVFLEESHSVIQQ